MSENLNLVEILKDCSKGTKLYSPIYGDIELVNVLLDKDARYPIQVKLSTKSIGSFTKDGRLYAEHSGECVLFPSREQRDWSKFKAKKPKFDPKTLRPFDKVMRRDTRTQDWECEFFSHIDDGSDNYPYITITTANKFCIPYNDDTKHLVGTTDEAPEYYRYWED